MKFLGSKRSPILLIRFDGWSSSILHSQVINKSHDEFGWCVSVEMTQRISLQSGTHRDFSCSIFSTDENCDVAIYRAYHVVLKMSHEE